MATKKPFRDRSPLEEALHRFVCDAHLKSEFLSEFWMFPERYEYLKKETITKERKKYLLLLK